MAGTGRTRLLVLTMLLAALLTALISVNGAVAALLSMVVVIALLLSPRLLPDRVAASVPADLSQHASTLIQHYRLDEGAFRLKLPAGTTVVGLDTTAYPNLTVVGHQRETVIIRAEPQAAARFAADQHLEMLDQPAASYVAGALMTPDMGVAELDVAAAPVLMGPGGYRSATTGSSGCRCWCGSWRFLVVAVLVVHWPGR